MAGLRSGWAGLVGVGAVLAAVLLPPTTAAAEPPFRVPTQITDRAGALSGGDQADVQAALDKLAAEDNVNLFVVYVDTFDNPTDSDSWAAQTAQLSSLGSNQTAAGDCHRGPCLRGQRAGQLQTRPPASWHEIAQTDIQPKLADDDWAGAAIAAANGYSDALGGSSAGWWWVAGGIVVVGGGGYLIYRRGKRKSTAGSGGQQQTGPDGAPQAPPEPLDQLSARSVQTLIDTDNAVRASEFELNAAETEFGSAAVAQFRAAFDSARESLTAAFEIRQRVDDEIPEDDTTKRAMMNEILQRCSDAASKLDSESDRFDNLRDLRSRLPQVLAELPGGIEAQKQRLAGVAGTLQRLQQQYAPTALATVAGNVDEATSRLTFARNSLQQAQQLATSAPVTAPLPVTTDGPPSAAGQPPSARMAS